MVNTKEKSDFDVAMLTPYCPRQNTKLFGGAFLVGSSSSRTCVLRFFYKSQKICTGTGRDLTACSRQGRKYKVSIFLSLFRGIAWYLPVGLFVPWSFA